MRITPDYKYIGKPCSYTGVGCAYEDTMHEAFNKPMPDNLKDDGYLSLDAANKFIRRYLPIRKKQYYKRSERITLKDFLQTNETSCCVCVYGHFIYVNGQDYWSFYENEDDDVVCVWYIKDVHGEQHEHI